MGKADPALSCRSPLAQLGATEQPQSRSLVTRPIDSVASSVRRYSDSVPRHGHDPRYIRRRPERQRNCTAAVSDVQISNRANTRIGCSPRVQGWDSPRVKNALIGFQCHLASELRRWRIGASSRAEPTQALMLERPARLLLPCGRSGANAGASRSRALALGRCPCGCGSKRQQMQCRARHRRSAGRCVIDAPEIDASPAAPQSTPRAARLPK